MSRTMNLKWIVVVYISFLPRALCLWGRDTGRSSTILSISDDRRDSSLEGSIHEDLGTMSEQLSALRLHSERSDCFRDASSILQSSCESLQFNPSERVRAQLCTSYRRLHEIDHAKSIYANITNEKIAFLSSLNGHYSRLHLRQMDLAKLTEIQARMDVLSSIILADAQALNRRAFVYLEEHLATIISEVQASLSLATTSTQTGIEATIRSLDTVALAWDSRLVMFNQRLDTIWEETFNRKMTLEQAIDSMRERVSQTDSQLELQLAAAERLQTLSSEASVSIEHANSQLLAVSDTLSKELGSLASVTQELQKNVTRMPDLMFKFNSAWLPGIFSPLCSIWSLRLPTWQAQLVMHFVGVGASGIQSSISALFTFICALLFVMTHAFRYASYMVGYILLRISKGGEKPIQSQKKSLIINTPRTYRRAQASRSRLASVLPRYETA
ncbi:unnamed protein product [Rhizoctonia solani]|uniref:Nuclear fusion protein KAR5 n=1 Tax=Rhizoctonia solani TaxID=456999 RepID=A0A8H3BS49_9AGAM|nr:unnamed protein product [Rhizoctonia solani]